MISNIFFKDELRHVFQEDVDIPVREVEVKQDVPDFLLDRFFGD